MIDSISEILVIGFKSSILIGIIYGIGAMGLSQIYKYLKFPDFTTLAAIMVGSVAAVQYTNEVGIAGGLFASALVGAFLGLLTAVQIVVFKIHPILAGLIVFVSSRSVAFWISSNQPTIGFVDDLRDRLDVIVTNVFSFYSFAVLIALCIAIGLGVAQIYRGRIGLYILGLQGSDSYLRNRHRKQSTATYVLLVGGNGLIGLAGGLASIQNNTATIPNHLEFLIIALGAYVSGNVFVRLLAKPNFTEHLDQAGPLYMKVGRFVSKKFQLNDEVPEKIFYILMSYVFFAAVINLIFVTVELNIGADSNRNWIFKSAIFFGILALTTFAERTVLKGE